MKFTGNLIVYLKLVFLKKKIRKKKHNTELYTCTLLNNYTTAYTSRNTLKPTRNFNFCKEK